MPNKGEVHVIRLVTDQHLASNKVIGSIYHGEPGALSQLPFHGSTRNTEIGPVALSCNVLLFMLFTLLEMIWEEECKRR
jgi:hypothetical protein